VLELWDAIFAEDPSLNIVEYICLVLLIRIRDKSKQLFDLYVGWLMSVITNYMASDGRRICRVLDTAHAVPAY
jgi:hypothetical protein